MISSGVPPQAVIVTVFLSVFSFSACSSEQQQSRHVLAMLPQQHNSACATWLFFTVFLLSRNPWGTSPGISSVMTVRSINAFLHLLMYLINRFFVGFAFIANMILLTLTIYHNRNSINCQIQQQSFLKRNGKFLFDTVMSVDILLIIIQENLLSEGAGGGLDSLIGFLVQPFNLNYAKEKEVGNGEAYYKADCSRVESYDYGSRQEHDKHIAFCFNISRCHC